MKQYLHRRSIKIAQYFDIQTNNLLAVIFRHWMDLKTFLCNATLIYSCDLIIEEYSTSNSTLCRSKNDILHESMR